MRRVLGLEVQIVNEDQQHAAGRVCRPRRGAVGRMMPSGAGGRRRVNGVECPAAVHERERVDRLRDAVLENREVAFVRSGMKRPFAIARDDIGGDVRHFGAKRRRLLRGHGSPSIREGSPRARTQPGELV